MATRALAGALVSLIALAAAAPSASAAPVPISGLRWVVAFSSAKGQLPDVVSHDCVSFGPVDWSNGRSRDKTVFLVGTPGFKASGSYDASTQRGAANESVTAFRFERVIGKGGAFELRDMGMEIAGGRAYLTARIVSVKGVGASAKRVRLAVIARPKFFTGPSQDPKGRSIPDSFLIAVQGRASVMPALAAAINRIRCTRPIGVIRPHKLKPGIPFGQVTVQLQPDGAVGMAGTSEIGDGPTFLDDEGVDIQAQPIGSTTVFGSADTRGLRFNMLAGTRTALTCQSGYRCVPNAGSQFGLAGGFTLSYNGRTATVDGLTAVESSGPSTRTLALTGSLNGQPMAISDSSGSAPEAFLTALSRALGLTFSRGFFDLTAQFSDTGPP
jgi:hypothetical protein